MSRKIPGRSPGFTLLNMGVVADVIFAVAMIAAAAGAVTELQFRMTCIGATTDGTFVGIGCLRLHCMLLICSRAGERNNLRTLGRALVILVEQPANFQTPGHGNHIQHICAKEQEIVCKRNDGEEIIGEGVCQQSVDSQQQIKQGEEPCFDGNDEKQQELCIGKHGGIAEEQAEVQIGDICLPAEKHTPR